MTWPLYTLACAMTLYPLVFMFCLVHLSQTEEPSRETGNLILLGTALLGTCALLVAIGLRMLLIL